MRSNVMRWNVLRLNAVSAVLLSFAFLGLAACRPAEEEVAEEEPAAAESDEQEEPAERIENGALGIALARVPAEFEVAANEGEELVLVRTAEDDPARLTFELGTLQTAGVNLVDEVWKEKERVEALPDGEYRGQNELAGVPLGTTFTSRGRFRDEESGEMVEEYRALLVHPSQNRLLMVDYEYPVPPPGEGQDQARLEELMLVLEQIEPILVEEAGPPPEEAVPAPEPTTGT